MTYIAPALAALRALIDHGVVKDPRRVLGVAATAARRAVAETRYAGTVFHAVGPGSLATPPHRYLGALTALTSQGPAGAGLRVAVAAHADDVAIRDNAGELTFTGLDRAANALAHHLLDLGFTAGDGLGILCRNHRGLFIALFAGAKLGAVTVLLNTDFSGPQLADVSEREGVRVLVADAEFADAVAAVRAPLATIGAVGEDPFPDLDNSTTLAAVLGDGRTTAAPRPARPQKLVLLTSGTTGTPKGAPRDLGMSLAAPGAYLSRIPLRGGRTTVLAAPAFHAWGMASSVMALSLGNTLVMRARFDPEQTLRDLVEHRADTLITVPILLARLLHALEASSERYDLSALRVVAVSGSALAPELAARAMDRFGDVLYNLYGSTEVAYAAIATPADLREAPGTVGRPPLGSVVAIYDEDGRRLGPGETGRIFVGSTIAFDGYTGGGSKDAIDGLLSTGDMGHLDQDGRLFVSGRDDDMIVSGGENVFPAEIEGLLADHPAIREAAVIGVEDADFGMRLRAFVVTKDGSELGEDEVRDHVKQNLARYKVPRDVVFVDALPRNPAGKVVKRELPAD